MDQELERAIDAALDEARATRPSPDFLPRVRAHVEQLPPAPIRWWIPLAASVTTIAAGVVVAATISIQDRISRQDHAQRPASAPGNSVVPLRPERPLRSESLESTVGRRQLAGSAPSRAVRRTLKAAEPEVLVPKSDRVAVARLLEALAAGDAHAMAVMRSARDDGEPAGVAVTPIEIAPVVVPPLKESL